MANRSRFGELERSYQSVSKKTWSETDFKEENLERSRFYFEEGLLPKRFDVLTALVGLPFSESVLGTLVEMQNSVKNIIKGTDAYFLMPENLHTEIFLLAGKPETDKDYKISPSLINNILKESRSALSNQVPFNIRYRGFMITPDGTVLAKGYDDGSLTGMRNKLAAHMTFKGIEVPTRQSGWCHASLGRILEPVGAAKFAKLRALVENSASDNIRLERVTQISIVHETRWYMAEKKMLATIPLKD